MKSLFSSLNKPMNKVNEAILNSVYQFYEHDNPDTKEQNKQMNKKPTRSQRIQIP